MFDFVREIIGVDTPYSVPIATMLFVACGATLIFIAREVRKAATHRMDLDAKREMVAQGMSAEEIDRVLTAGRVSTDEDA